MWSRGWSAWSARVLLVTFSTSGVTGCVSARVARVTPGAVQGGTGVLEVRVFDDRADEDRSAVTGRRIVSELWRLDGTPRLVHTSHEPRYALAGLETGRYELRVEQQLDEQGTTHRLPSADNASFLLAAGDAIVAHVVLKHPRRALIGLAIGAGVALAVGITLFLVNQTISLTAWSSAGGG
ncbi:MAG: hypothetical protein V1750_07135 [Acidobacteriota bacterium]